MIPSTDLFNLIRSLSKSEQRYIALILKQNAEKNYGKLFAAIAAQDNYDEELIKRTYKTESFVKQFRFTKNYLYNLILKHLRNYYSESSVTTNILNKLIDIEVLIEKNFYKQAYKRLKTLLVLTEQHELFHLQTVCQNVLRRLYYLGVYEIDPNEIKRQESKALSFLSDLKEFSDINLDVHENNVHHGLYHKSKIAKLNLRNISKNKKRPLSVISNYLYLNAILSHYGNKRNFNTIFWKALADCELLFKNNPDFAIKKPLLLVNYLRNRALTEILNNKMNEALDTIDTIENFDKLYTFRATSGVKFKFFESIATVKMEYFYETKQFGEILNELPGMMEKAAYFEKQAASLDVILKLKLSMSMFYFIDKQYKGTIKILHSIINDKTAIVSYTKEKAKLMLLLCHFELKNNDTFMYLLKAYPPKKRTIESLIILFLKNAISENMLREKYIKELMALKEKLADHNGLATLRRFFDILGWIDSKIQNVSYKKILEGC